MCKILTTYQGFCNSFCTAQNSPVAGVFGVRGGFGFEVGTAIISVSVGVDSIDSTERTEK
jgi:hypothetical protein